MFKFLLIDGKYNTIEIPIADCAEALKRIKVEDIKRNNTREELNANITRFLEGNGDKFPGRRKERVE